MLNVEQHQFTQPGFRHLPAVISDIKAERTFEVSYPARVAIWHGGFVHATDRLDSIITWLKGDDDEDILAADQALGGPEN